jgi:hypothetical protein
VRGEWRYSYTHSYPLTAAGDQLQALVSLPTALSPRKELPVLVGGKLDGFRKRAEHGEYDNFFPLSEMKPDSSVIQLVASSLYRLSYSGFSSIFTILTNFAKKL